MAPKSASKRKATEITNDDDDSMVNRKLTKKERIEKQRLARQKASKWADKLQAKQLAKKEAKQRANNDDDDDVVRQPRRKRMKIETIATTGNGADGGHRTVPAVLSTKEDSQQRAREAKAKAQKWSELDKANLEKKKRKTTKKTSRKTTGSIATSTCRPKIETSTSTSPFSDSKMMRRLPPQQYLPNNRNTNIARSGPGQQTTIHPRPIIHDVPSPRFESLNPSSTLAQQQLDRLSNSLLSSKEDSGAMAVQQQQQLQQQRDHFNYLLSPKTSGVNVYDTGIANVPRVQQTIPRPVNIPSQGCVSSPTLSSPVQQQPNRDGVNAYDTVTSFDTIPTISQMTQQVLTNAQDNRYEQEHYHDPSSIENDSMNGDNAEQLHDDAINTESTNDAAMHNNALNFIPTNFFRLIAFLVVCIVLGSFLSPLELLSNEVTDAHITRNDEPLSNEVTDANITRNDDRTCYYHPGDMEKEDFCSENNGNMVPCPRGGICSGGILIKCSNVFQDLSEAEDRCTLSKKYLPMTKVITEELVNAASAKCSLFTDPVDYDSLQTKYPEIMVERNLELIKALECEGFRSHQDEEGRLYLNLPEDFVLNLPLYCKLGEAASSLFEAIGYVLWKVTTFFLTNIWGFLKNYPKVSIVVFVGFLFFCAVHKRGVKREKRERDTELMRKMAYEFLETHSSSAHQILHVRDDCTNELYPNSRKQRQILNNDIWPRVVTNLKYDTRVRKTTRMSDGNVRDMWQWAAHTE